MKAIISTVILLLSFIAGESVATSQRDVPREIVYSDAARTFHETFSSETHSGTNTLPKHLIGTQKTDLFFSETLGEHIQNCSDKEFICIRALRTAYAIPRRRLSKRDAYSLGGILFKVEDCLRGEQDICQVALISADCQKAVGESDCEKASGGREHGSNAGPLVYFIYNEDYGVTAYGVTNETVGSPKERLNIASQMILEGGAGLLKK
jgi:hypothetical protein